VLQTDAQTETDRQLIMAIPHYATLCAIKQEAQLLLGDARRKSRPKIAKMDVEMKT